MLYFYYGIVHRNYIIYTYIYIYIIFSLSFRGKKRARPGHFLALCGLGPQMSLQLGKAVGEVKRTKREKKKKKKKCIVDINIYIVMICNRTKREIQKHKKKEILC
jgi:hypothetical protein